MSDQPHASCANVNLLISAKRLVNLVFESVDFYESVATPCELFLILNVRIGCLESLAVARPSVGRRVWAC